MADDWNGAVLPGGWDWHALGPAGEDLVAQLRGLYTGVRIGHAPCAAEGPAVPEVPDDYLRVVVCEKSWDYQRVTKKLWDGIST